MKSRLHSFAKKLLRSLVSAKFAPSIKSAMKRSILFLCTANAIRSQMAKGWLEHLSSDFIAYSAGILPNGQVDDLAVEVMRDVGIDIASYRSQEIETLRHTPIDILITMSSTAYRECPSWLYSQPNLISGHWGFEDVSGKSKSRYRRLRDEIGAHICAFLAAYHPEQSPSEVAALVRKLMR